MKPFDLEEYKKNPSRELVTRDGHKARIIYTDAISKKPIVALVLTERGECVLTYTEYGYLIDDVNISGKDLFFASVKHQGWINIYKDKQGFCGQKIYETEECAKNASLCIQNYVATITVEWEE